MSASLRVGLSAALGRGHAMLAVVTFPLQTLASAIEERTETWAALNMARRAFPVEENYGKAVARVEMESDAWVIQIMVWITGEAELETLRLTDARIVNKHYELAGRQSLELLLDELARLLVQDDVPNAALVFYTPGRTAR